MKIIDKNIKSVTEDEKLNSKFINSYYQNFDMNCNILSNNFYIDTHNYFPLTEEFFSFSDIFSWGDRLKYQNFYSKNFQENLEEKLNDFKSLSDVFILGSSSYDNYYRNLFTFLPRIFFNKDKKIKIAIHRNSSNKFKNFIKILCKKMNVDIQFVFLDDGFYKFVNSKIPQFLNKIDSIKILHSLKINDLPKDERIYITRKNCAYRNLINEIDVINKLKKINFRVVDLDSLTILEQIKLFSNAEIIVAPSGSALTNIVFCNPGTKVLEISPQYNFSYEDNFKNRFSFISNELKLDYLRIEAEPVNILKIDNKITNFISPKVIKESNYYKNLIIKIEKIDQFIKI